MRLTVSNLLGDLYFIDSICGELNKCKLTKALNMKEMIINCSQQELYDRWHRWKKGTISQIVFNNLTTDELEFIMIGTISLLFPSNK